MWNGIGSGIGYSTLFLVSKVLVKTRTSPPLISILFTILVGFEILTYVMIKNYGTNQQQLKCYMCAARTL